MMLAGCGAHPGPASSGPTVQATAASTTTTLHGRVGVHGMIVFGGQNATYLSHIPMFHAPHDVQLLMEVSFDARAATLPATYGSKLYTFVPETMSLDDVRTGAKTSFQGTLYDGNFEQGGQPIADGVTATVTRVLFDRNLDSAAEDPPSPDYVLLGRGADTTLVRIIHAAQTSIDELSTFTLAPGSTLSDDDLARGVIVTQAAGRGDDPSALDLSTPNGAVQGKKATVLSCLTAPMFEDPCN